MNIEWVRYSHAHGDLSGQETYMFPGPFDVLEDSPALYAPSEVPTNSPPLLHQITHSHYRLYLNYSISQHVIDIEIFQGKHGNCIYEEKFTPPFQYTKENIFPYVNKCLLLAQI